jgi:CheY-like chemotaxis protein
MTILVVEDDATIRELVKEVLGDEGYPVVAVATTEEALGVLQGGAGVRLVLLDLVLPGLGGQHLCHWLSADPALATIPVVLASGSARLEKHAAALQAAAALAKPFDLDQLLAVVGRLYTP